MMKKLLLIFVTIVLVSAATFGQRSKTKAIKTPVVKKTTKAFTREKFDPKRDPNVDLATAIKTASRTGKRIILDVGGEWCGWCVHMDKFLFQNPSLDKIRNDSFVWVKINMSEENENVAFLSGYPEIKGYPHLYVLDEAGNFIHSQDTVDLEKKDTYDLAKFTLFIKTWALPKK